MAKTERVVLYTVAEVAEASGMHPGSIRKRLIEGRSDGFLVAGRWVFTAGQKAELIQVAKPRAKRGSRA